MRGRYSAARCSYRRLCMLAGRYGTGGYYSTLKVRLLDTCRACTGVCSAVLRLYSVNRDALNTPQRCGRCRRRRRRCPAEITRRVSPVSRGHVPPRAVTFPRNYPAETNALYSLKKKKKKNWYRARETERENDGGRVRNVDACFFVRGISDFGTERHRHRDARTCFSHFCQR